MRPAVVFVSAAAAGLFAALVSAFVVPPRPAAPVGNMSVPLNSLSRVEPAASPTPVPAGASPIPAPTATAAPADKVQLCPGRESLDLVDNRLLGHIRYPEADRANLVAPPTGFESTNCQQIDSGMKASLTAMIAAAGKDDPQIAKVMMGVSCFRSIERQRGLFCNPAKLDARGVAGQAKWIAPPGFSEHATGFAIDFGVRSKPECHANPCFAQTRTGKWLAANARKFGFELSFPSGNKQGVSFEPWHWRWTGSDRAKTVFERARRDFPSP
ncbi:MAG: M15 family metallopeptidase [Pseudomonadota bacterium]